MKRQTLCPRPVRLKKLGSANEWLTVATYWTIDEALTEMARRAATNPGSYRVTAPTAEVLSRRDANDWEILRSGRRAARSTGGAR